MIPIRRIKPNEWKLVRSVRLTALADAPYAYDETLDVVSEMPDRVWQSRIQQNSEGKKSTCALTVDDESPVGMAVGLLDEDDRNRAHLVAMWVAPNYRGSGIAWSLVEFIVKWAKSSGAAILDADVTEHNERAKSFYRKAGFEPLPEHRPWPPDRTKSVIPMQLNLKK